MLTQPLSFDAIQKTLSDRVTSHLSPGGTTVVLPSLSFPTDELAKITAIERYEERLLNLLLRLAHPDARIVYLTSLPIHPAVIDYYLGFLPDPAAARERLSLIDLGHFTGRGLATDLADDHQALDRVRAAIGDDTSAVILPFNVTDAERRVAVEVEAPLFAAHPDLVALGSKTGSRRAAVAVGVPVLPGVEDLWSTDAISAAVDELRLAHPGVDAVVVKLNNGFSGQGNAMVTWTSDHADLADRRTEFCAGGETWGSFTAKIAREGAIVEQLVTYRSASPSAQAWISPSGALRIVSTHDQMLGGPGGQVYLGCRYPADPAYRAQIIAHTEAVGRHLADKSVTGPFAIDFIVVDPDDAAGPQTYLSEINLRLGGTTHPFGMARVVLGADMDPAADGLASAHGPRVYIASDNIKEAALIGRSPTEVITRVRDAGLAFDPATHTGVTLHLLGAVTRYGKLGAVAIAADHEAAERLYTAVLDALRSDG
ncbi:peptide ligase PGM1-related protein [soil metagenome]